jgi:hypothetical protein
VVYHVHNFNLRSIFWRPVDALIALSKGLNVPRARNWGVSRLGYFIKEARYITANEGGWKWLPYSVTYETTRMLGVALGWLRGRMLRNI